MSNFLKLAEDTFVEQINTNLAYLTPGQNLFDQMIGTIRGIVEVEQAKRDRSLERTIQVLGIGFGGGAIISGVITIVINVVGSFVVELLPGGVIVELILLAVLYGISYGIFGILMFLIYARLREIKN